MSKKSVALGASAVLIGASYVSFGSTGLVQAQQHQSGYSLNNPPHVAGATHKYAGQSVTFYGDGVGIGHNTEMALANRFTKDTGIKVKVVIKPQDSNAAYSAYERLFGAKSSNFDVMMLDVVWPGSFANFLVNLKPVLGSNTSRYYSSIIANNTVGGHLVGIPYFSDFGMLYYRKDLLTKYHISSPPTTWEMLQKDAKKIQAGEQKKSKSFYGFVFQGKAYEGLTCNALEWIASAGGGTIIQNGKITLNNPKAAKILDLIHGFVGTISPRDVTTYTETESDNAFNNGQAAFLRNWPYAYAVAQAKGSKIKGKVGVAQLPHEAGGQSSGTVGGWQLGVSKYSKHVKAAEEFVKYMTGPQVSTWRAVVGSYTPSMPSEVHIPAVLKAMPFLRTAGNEQRVTRPSRFLGTNYNQASNIFWTSVSQILNGSPASSVLPNTQTQLQRLLQH